MSLGNRNCMKWRGKLGGGRERERKTFVVLLFQTKKKSLKELSYFPAFTT